MTHCDNHVTQMTMKNIPSKEEILEWIRLNPDKTSKRDIGKAFGIKGAARIDLKRLLKELIAEGHIQKERKSFRQPGELPPVSLLRVSSIDSDGELWAEALEWDSERPKPKILYVQKKNDPGLAVGDRILCRLSPESDDGLDYTARLIRLIGKGPTKIVGLYRSGSEGGRIVPIDKKSDKEWRVLPHGANGAKDGVLVEAVQKSPKRNMGLPIAEVVEVIGDPMAPKAISLIAIHQHEIPDHFPDEAIVEAEKATNVELGARKDLRNIPLFTIDPSDARDRDDAICAIPDSDPKNKGGFVLWVAIADVSHFVRLGSSLDREAQKRGNSSYFPDRVVPMLPDALSGDLCSLHDNVERACMAVEIRINSLGEKLDHQFHRGLMNSKASLNYAQANAAFEGEFDDMTAPLKTPLQNLYSAFQALLKSRAFRQPLNLDLPERQIVLSSEGKVLSVDFKERLDAHKLVEEFMVLANVCAAETLEAKGSSLLYRVHEEPSPEKLDALREVAAAAGLQFAKGQVLKTSHLNKLLDGAADTEDSELVNMSVLRSMTQAYYSPKNFGHFGLNLKRYAHFTSPIRRYADLIVHRALIAAHHWGDDGLQPDETERLFEIGEWISQTERRSMLAERDTNDRYLAAYLSERVGTSFSGRISGIAKFGVFVKLDDTGADGIVPLSQLGNEYWRFSEQDKTLRGEKSGRLIALGMPVKTNLVDATAVTGGLTLEITELNGKPMPKGGAKRRSKSRKMNRNRSKKSKR